MHTLTLVSLKCVKQQETDLTSGDEVQVWLSDYLDGAGLLSLTDILSMKTEDEISSFKHNDIPFNGTPIIVLVEQDNPDIGDASETATWPVEEVPGSDAATFNLGDGAYVLGYYVKAIDDSTSDEDSEAEEGAVEEPAEEPVEDPPAEASGPPGQILKYVTTGKDVTPEQLYDEYKEIIESIGDFESEIGAYNLLGIRKLQQDSRTIDDANTWDKYNDTIAVIWLDDDGQKRVLEYKASCDPGDAWKTTKRVKGYVTHLCDGQSKYKAGTHTSSSYGTYAALRPASEQYCWLDYYRRSDGSRGGTQLDNEYNHDDPHILTSTSGCNIHAAGSGTEVNKWSAGCQVIWGGRSGSQYTDFIGNNGTRLGGLMAKHFANHTRIYYTLITAVEKPKEDESSQEIGAGEVGDSVTDCPNERESNPELGAEEGKEAEETGERGIVDVVLDYLSDLNEQGLLQAGGLTLNDLNNLTSDTDDDGEEQ